MNWLFYFILPFLITLCITPLIKKLAIFIGATDRPNERKVHSKTMPRLGGLGIIVAVTLSTLFFTDLSQEPVKWIIMGSLFIGVVGILDDIYDLSVKTKLITQILAAMLVVHGGIRIEFINLPLIEDPVYFGNWSWIITIVWIVGVTNALNFIDGLDGLAAGVSSITLGTICIMALMMGNLLVFTFTLILLGATLGFLFHNFYPAKIFMGDSGSLYLGFYLGALSVLGFKNVTVTSFIIPILILGVPIFDTIFAIIRRFRSRQPITSPDKKHLHHCLINMGYSHRTAVLIIYGISSIFSLAAIFLTQTTMWIGNLLIISLVVFVMIGAEWTGVMGSTKKPFLNFLSHYLFRIPAKFKEHR
ncbi:UDP-GlcNAc:undecaprenyl-phosphate GlcNAc-1-phosphate transferase [Caldalkalibacillus uzonensis]|uniref:UDP-GlcNAc:undecaprenyl-phosphate GlcNAc-1-phosphate transferase n=1 Tax=Caldalkalibacillus uzonensis TaxID=353224 RepID=A0ABU0CTX6_9BACI|nr:MraY family glycosyltransferase [Caldalkalibacillus uzonensis]MDQ0339876.1 UDP-GlcNAc:undecaprenyl-phosphate GlcNAc-1-phosphate transferase [Caldalkalibacillus uzonensis]